jgi:hypothetical protein
MKDEFGAPMVRVRGHAKVMCHRMFGIVALTADQILRLIVSSGHGSSLLAPPSERCLRRQVACNFVGSSLTKANTALGH